MRAYILRYGTKIYWRLRLAKSRVPASAPLAVHKDISYTGTLRKAHKLDIYCPAHATSALPIVIFVHGGGFIMGDKHERRDICRELAAQGFVVFNINYRLSPEHRFPAAVIDTLRAMEWVKTHAAEYGADPDNLNIVADSSGAHIAAIAIAATTNKTLRDTWGVTFPLAAHAKKAVLYYGFYNLHDAQNIKRKYFKIYMKAYIGTLNLKRYKYINAFSPIDFIHPGHPETLLITSEADPLCPQTLQMAERLDQNSVPCRLVVFDKTDYPEALHGFIADAKTPAARQAFAAVCDFLKD